MTLPKTYWKEIRLAEKDEKIFNQLMKKYKARDVLHRKTRDNSLDKNFIPADDIFINDDVAKII